MFEPARLLGPTEQSIVVETRKRRRIANSVEPEPGSREQHRYRTILSRFGGNWVERRPATGCYNCAGHVWASRRTSLHDPEQWRSILADDGYRRLPNGQPPAPGDLALYVDEKDEILHVGEVLEMREGLTPEGAKKPWVLSKLDDQSGEVMHWDHDLLPLYRVQQFSPRIEYWTDRLSD